MAHLIVFRERVYTLGDRKLPLAPVFMVFPTTPHRSVENVIDVPVRVGVVCHGGEVVDRAETVSYWTSVHHLISDDNRWGEKRKCEKKEGTDKRSKKKGGA